MEPIIKEVAVKEIITKTKTPIGGYVANPYTGCLHGCKYCYASFMKRFTGHKEPWGSFSDVKYWEPIKNRSKYFNELITIGTVTDGYNPLEEKYLRTRTLLKELIGSGCKISILTKSSLVLRDIDLLRQFKDVTISFSINTLDEEFKNDMDNASSISSRLQAMETLYNEGFKVVCFISPIFPLITNVIKIIERVKNIVDFIWLENLNLRGDFKSTILDYIVDKYPEYLSTYNEIYKNNNLSYWKELEVNIKEYIQENNFFYADNYFSRDKGIKGQPTIINYLFHEEIRGSDNSGKRSK